MPSITIAKRFEFQAAHQLPNHKGHCQRLHGHSYEVEVGITGPVNLTEGASDEGMVIDFGDVSAAFKKRVHDVCDHQYLNDVLPMLTTAENIAAWILAEMQDELDPTVAFVRVWETRTGHAEARP